MQGWWPSLEGKRGDKGTVATTRNRASFTRRLLPKEKWRTLVGLAPAKEDAPRDMALEGAPTIESVYIALSKADGLMTVSYTHLTLPTNREV